ncbi:MAG: AmmeMemoRadiSam system radical SAM enzyme [Acidobacteria bacterium]|nr:AmmeMemoRadiSam system radical SAM enzyme [Acidobacteriota bacterium]
MAEILSGPVARWWHRLDDGRVQCDLCPRNCKLHEGQRAFCFVRARRGDELVLTTYGRSTGFCIDPIEKKPLNHFYPGTPVLSFGTAGCNLGCRFCQNWDISKSREFDRLADTATPRGLAAVALRLHVTSVAFTYNDPVLWAEYAIDCARACRAAGLKTVAVTAGYIAPEARAEFFAAFDAANVDLKGFTDEFYRKICFGELQPVLDTLLHLRASGTWLEITTLLIPGQNDGEEEVDRLSEWIRRELGPEVPLHFTAFHPDFQMRDVPPTPAATLVRARQQALARGLKHVYTGNVHDRSGQSTYCAGCGRLLVERDWYELGAYNLTPEGACRSCGRAVAGRFAAAPGNWGSRRVPVAVGV